MAGQSTHHTPRRAVNLLGRSAARTAVAPAKPEVPSLTTRIVDGVQQDRWHSERLADALSFARNTPEGMAVTLISHPTPTNIAELSTAWELHPLLVEDLLHADQRPKLERYDDVLFIAVRAARYIDATEEVEFSEFHILTRPGALVLICQDGRLLDGSIISEEAAGTGIDDRLKGVLRLQNPELIRLGSEALVYQLLDAIVDACFPVLDGLQIDKEQIERQVFSGDDSAAERIYRLNEEVIDLLHANTALAQVLRGFQRGAEKYAIPDELQAYLQDVADHLVRVISEVTELRSSLSQVLSVNSTLVAQRQNEDMKKISGWAAILFAPTLIAAIYGMNFDVMPELHWAFGYPTAVVLMFAFAAGLFWFFKRKKWM
ncbi:magnesium and cobalt transport protein CorA [Leucobacter sp. CSA2]|uniref:Magnesium and cobalt transport protein CorA n=1 Tax=Leucobacter edaphi TaxID=2796472 RepID=A0A934QE15_9MICO|nr:magnesium and cobalt transport protein CorA [Leucobacter edaphi]MBK0422533.1 magnesium and cobalt transport protein CorA [Leucobacter edaphi]